MTEPTTERTRMIGVPVLVMEARSECVRCVRIAATGRLAYEFTSLGNSKTVRIDADLYDAALAEAREDPIEEAWA